MTAVQFTEWRGLLKIRKSEAARLLGCSPNSVTAYEAGRVAIPQYIALACRALANNLKPWGA